MATEKPRVKSLLSTCLLLVVPGIASLFVPIPHSETQDTTAEDLNIGVQTSHRECVPPIIRAVPIAGGSARLREYCPGEV